MSNLTETTAPVMLFAEDLVCHFMNKLLWENTPYNNLQLAPSAGSYRPRVHNGFTLNVRKAVDIIHIQINDKIELRFQEMALNNDISESTFETYASHLKQTYFSNGIDGVQFLKYCVFMSVLGYHFYKCGHKNIADKTAHLIFLAFPGDVTPVTWETLERISKAFVQKFSNESFPLGCLEQNLDTLRDRDCMKPLAWDCFENSDNSSSTFEKEFLLRELEMEMHNRFTSLERSGGIYQEAIDERNFYLENRSETSSPNFFDTDSVDENQNESELFIDSKSQADSEKGEQLPTPSVPLVDEDEDQIMDRLQKYLQNVYVTPLEIQKYRESAEPPMDTDNRQSSELSESNFPSAVEDLENLRTGLFSGAIDRFPEFPSVQNTSPLKLMNEDRLEDLRRNTRIFFVCRSLRFVPSTSSALDSSVINKELPDIDYDFLLAKSLSKTEYGENNDSTRGYGAASSSHSGIEPWEVQKEKALRIKIYNQEIKNPKTSENLPKQQASDREKGAKSQKRSSKDSENSDGSKVKTKKVKTCIQKFSDDSSEEDLDLD